MTLHQITTRDCRAAISTGFAMDVNRSVLHLGGDERHGVVDLFECRGADEIWEVVGIMARLTKTRTKDLDVFKNHSILREFHFGRVETRVQLVRHVYG